LIRLGIASLVNNAANGVTAKRFVTGNRSGGLKWQDIGRRPVQTYVFRDVKPGVSPDTSTGKG
jgi:hypothetical protein